MEEREEKQEARAAATRGKAKESGMDSALSQTSGRLRRTSADSKSAAWTKKRCTRQGCIFQQVPGTE